MDGRAAGRAGELTVDHLVTRVEQLEREVAVLQRAYIELQASVRPRPRAATADGPAETAAGQVDIGDADDLTPT